MSEGEDKGMESLYRAAQSIYGMVEASKIPPDKSIQELINAVSEARGTLQAEMTQRFEDIWKRTSYFGSGNVKHIFTFRVFEAERGAAAFVRESVRHGYVLDTVERDNTEDEFGNPCPGLFGENEA